MGDNIETSDETVLDEEALLQKHRKERKDLQAKITSLKKSITKGDKKKRKDVLEQIAELETALNTQQEEELAALKPNKKEDSTVQVITESIGDLRVLEEETEVPIPVRVSKTQRRRERKVAEFKERERIAKAEEQDPASSAKYIETEAINKILKSKGLMIKDVPSDGDCMYSAVKYQLSEKNLPVISVSDLRHRTSDQMRSKSSEFLPYLCHPDTGLVFSPEEYAEYCDKVANTHEWGTQIELRALSHALNCGIEVVQATGPALMIGEEYVEDGGYLTITFHRHMYQLGAHYNSVTTYQEPENEDDF
nr:PREDICTED: OTU domain-containing protein 6B [Bemisia tabaci]XP_018914807.1 PREDICTED: OTU domain-containing protein 6B [Bemisia tabaci]